ncbi:MAG: dTMP kinase [Planctomycetota bacterium]|nr:dTMP kinase [Planctomycetota bacterium]MDG1985683.1 dTMP kinase [Planctomycetota bacterium]
MHDPVATDSMAPRPGGVRPLFVVLDGVDGCGKTTQAARLAASLAAQRPAGGEGSLHLREPGSTTAGERIRELVLAPDLELGRGTLAMLFAAARRETLEQLVAPAMAAGRDVVIERFHASTYAYQGSSQLEGGEAASPFSDEGLLSLLRTWSGAPVPDVEVILDLPPTVAFERASARDGGPRDRFEARGVSFQEGVSAAMRDYASRVPTAVVVDGAGSEDEVAARVLGAVLQRAGVRA